jgi:hypothetical protein
MIAAALRIDGAELAILLWRSNLHVHRRLDLLSACRCLIAAGQETDSPRRSLRREWTRRYSIMKANSSNPIRREGSRVARGFSSAPRAGLVSPHLLDASVASVNSALQRARATPWRAAKAVTNRRRGHLWTDVVPSAPVGASSRCDPAMALAWSRATRPCERAVHTLHVRNDGG